jgi:uncharacterized membrane protein YhhN
MLPHLLTALVAAALAGLLWCEAREARRAAFFWKLSASLGFVALAVVLGAFQHGVAARLIGVGLVLAASGDVALAVPDHRGFFVGLGLFLLGHLAYAGAFAAVVPLTAWPSAVAVVPVAATAGAYWWLSPRLGSMRGPVVAYMVAITVMVVGAIAVQRAAAPGATGLLLGATLFYLSDLSVARDRFVQRAFVNRAWGLPAYYAGQVLLAWATR